MHPPSVNRNRKIGMETDQMIQMRMDEEEPTTHIKLWDSDWLKYHLSGDYLSRDTCVRTMTPVRLRLHVAAIFINGNFTLSVFKNNIVHTCQFSERFSLTLTRVYAVRTFQNCRW